LKLRRNWNWILVRISLLFCNGFNPTRTIFFATSWEFSEKVIGLVLIVLIVTFFRILYWGTSYVIPVLQLQFNKFVNLVN
jgi:hypothetical protein